MDELEFGGADVLIIAILVLALGHAITQRVAFLRSYSIPLAVTGGLICSLAVFAIEQAGGPKVTFDLQLRDLLLLIFFSTIGMSAKFNRLKSGGKPLAILTVCAAVFLVLQNVTGVLLATLMGGEPAYGLFAGSISLAGGHGTAIAWGQELSASGMANADLIGVAFATFGLVAGGIIGGPIGERLIRKHKLSPTPEDPAPAAETAEDEAVAAAAAKDKGPITPATMRNMLILAICVSLGEVVNNLFSSAGVKLPGFLTSMLVGIIITNLLDALKRPVVQSHFDKIGEVALHLFLAMSLMSMDLASLAGGMNLIMLALFVQVLVMTSFAMLVVFRVMGRDYDAAIMASGFSGLGLGATPVAIANMNAVTSKHGPSFKAFLVVPLVGAFFIDLLNAGVIKFFLGLPMMQAGGG